MSQGAIRKVLRRCVKTAENDYAAEVMSDKSQLDPSVRAENPVKQSIMLHVGAKMPPAGAHQ